MGKTMKLYFSLKHIALFSLLTANQIVYYFWILLPNEEPSNRWNLSQKVLIWIELAIQFLIQALTIHQWTRYTPEEAMQIIKIEHSLKDEDDDCIIRLPEGLLDLKFRFLFTLLTFGLAITHGYSNLKVENSISENHYQLLVFACICISNWQEAKVFLGKYDMIIGSFSYLLCVLIDSQNYSKEEFFFIFLSFAFFFCTYVYSFQFQSYGMTFVDNEVKNGMENHQKSPPSQINNNLLSSGDEGGNKKLITNNNTQHDKQLQASKKVMFFQFPFSQSINYNNLNVKRPSAFTFDPQISASRKTIGNGIFNANSEQILDTKMSRILNSINPHTSVPKSQTNLQESINQHLLFYQGMIDKLDSAIFVIGGPNRVYEALNEKANSFFAPYLKAEGIQNANDYKHIFELITLKDYNKSCYNYLESVGVSKIDMPTCSSPSKQMIKKGTLNNLINSQVTTHYYSQKTRSPSTHLMQPAKQSSFINQNTLNQKTYSTSYSEGNGDSVKKQKTGDNQSYFKFSAMSQQFPDITLLGLLEKIQDCKRLDEQIDCIEVIEFTSSKELQDILKFVQIKIYGFWTNGEEFLFVQFAKNQEREELMRQTIHKDIEYSTFKTISHELGTYINFMLLILEGAMLDKSIPLKCKEDYFNNLFNNAQFLSCIIQDIRDYHSHLNNNLKVQIKSTHLRTLVVNTCMLFSQITKMKEIEFEVLISDDVPQKIFTDKQKIQQILIHLIQNALKFSKQKSQICVSVNIHSSEQNKQKIISFTVADVGIGMDKEEAIRLKQLLDNVYLSEKVSIHSSGFGFGLTISNIIAKKLHSNHPQPQDTLNLQAHPEQDFSPGIHFKSEKNVGSDFYFYINATDSENLVALSISNEKSDKNLLNSAKYQRVKKDEYEYFEHEDDIEISQRETNAETNYEMRVVDYLSEIYQTQSVQKSFIRPLSKKITSVFEKSHFITKGSEKSRFGPDFLGIGKTNTLLGDNNINNNNNRLNVERKGQKKFTHSFLINSYFQKRSETLHGCDDMEEDVQVGQMPVLLKSKTPVKHSQKILIVDDEMMNIFGLKMMFRVLGVDQNLILQANNGEEALNIYQQYLNSQDKQQQIKLIIMDINMPVMDGIEATKKINQIMTLALNENKQFLETNIVACSSYDDYDTKLNCLKAGMISYISKPCNKDCLSHIIEKYYYNEKK